MRISLLVVDDDAEFREALSSALRTLFGAAFIVHTAVSGRDALNKLEGNKVDIIITDTNMEEVNGIQLLEEVKRRYTGIEVIVLFDGLYGSTISKAQVMALGAVEVLKKCEIKNKLRGYFCKLLRI
jgi:CheY-like chemotaxis protein